MQIESNHEYAHLDFSGDDWTGLEVKGSQFDHCQFRGTLLTEWMTQSCIFTLCDFSGAHFNASQHTRSAFLNCQFRMANLFSTKFVECKMTGSSFEESNLDALTIQGGDWSYTHLRFHRLKGLNLRDVSFVEADLYECNLEKCDFQNADLSRAVLAHAILTHADLRGAKVDAVDWRSFDLTNVRLDLVQAVDVARAFGAKVE
jgi:fluoroquinolone resistance protein